MDYIDEIRIFLKECNLFVNESKGLFITNNYYIRYDKLYIYIHTRPSNELLYLTKSLDIFKIMILHYEGYFYKSIQLLKLHNEITKLINIYNQYYVIPYNFVWDDNWTTPNINLNYLIESKKIQSINWNPFEAISHLKQKINDMEYELYAPESGSEYFYYEQLYNSIIQNE